MGQHLTSVARKSREGWRRRASGEVDPLDRHLLPLFKKPFYYDWTVVLGAFVVGIGAWNSAIGYPPLWTSTPVDLADSALNIGIQAVINVCLFTYVPAAIRRRWTRGWAASNPPREKDSRVWMVAFIVVVSAVLAAGTVSAQESSSPLGERQCTPNGGDLICFTLISATDNAATLAGEWIYGAPRSLGSTSISKWTWRMSLSCSTRSGTLHGVAALNPSGGRLALTNGDYERVRNGMQRDQVPAAVSHFC